MKSLQDAIQPILSHPTPAALVEVQGALLALGGEASGPVLEIAGHFYAYLNELQSKVTARDYSELASRLDIGAVGAVALENILAGKDESLMQSLLLGGLGEALMVAASRQYIKGWEVEAGLVHSRTAWYLAEALWRTSEAMQPELAAEARWQAIESLLAPARDPDVAAPVKALLLGRIFQVLLLAYLARLQPDGEGGS
jgi:hypothetical protein